ncbi:MAG: Ig-like domain-containing protein [Bacteroidales bacterium]|nr:Ig-like domain-containing protein [Bacteroidales bacterium]
MKRVFAFLAVIAMVCMVSCKKEDPTVTATITAGDVTVDVGQTAEIGASTNSTAAITYASADASVAAVSANGTVTGMKAGSTTITLKVAAVEGKFTAAEKTINVKVNEVVVPPTSAITIDGDFSDWSKLEAGTFKRAFNDPDSPWEGVQEIRCFADPDHVFYYIKYNAEYLAELLDNEAEILPIRLCINTDGEFTSGYTSYFLEGYDFIIEGALAENKAFTTYSGEMHQRIGSWVSLAKPEDGVVTGKGAGSEYEIMPDRALFNEFAAKSSVPMLMGDEFQTGIRFYFINSSGKWDELSNMPNSSIDEEAGNGWGYLMRISTNK